MHAVSFLFACVLPGAPGRRALLKQATLVPIRIDRKFFPEMWTHGRFYAKNTKLAG